MKLTVVLLTTFLLQAHAAVVGQSITLHGKNMPLKEVFAVVEKQTGYFVFGKNELFRGVKPVSLSVKNMPLEDFLQVALKEQPLNYRIDGKNIILSRKPVVQQLLDQPVPLAPLGVSGVIYSASGEPLAGVSIRVKGTRAGAISNAQGAFALKDLPDNALLVISMIGFETMELRIRHTSEGYTVVPEHAAHAALLKVTSGEHVMANITLSPSDSRLDGVQVIAYGATTERLNVGNVTTVRSVDIDRQPVNNPLYALQGRVPGLMITPTTGLAGGEVKLQIRGHNSLSSGSDPLIVVDGLPIPNNVPGLGYPGLDILSSLSFLNPHDIESISVLKDADATSIYGSRGSNGVILVTTKKGKAGKTVVDLRVQNGQADVPVKIDMLNTQQYMALRKEAYANSGVDFINTFPYNVPAYKYELAYDLFIWDTTRYTDWQEELLGGKAHYLDAQATVSGGTPTVKYTLGGMYHRETSVFPGSDNADSRGGAHFSITGTTPNQRFRASLTASYMMNKYVLPGVDLTAAALRLPPNAPSIYLPDGQMNWAPKPSGEQSWENPFAALNKTSDSRVNNLLSSAEISYKLFPFLTLRTQVGYSNLQGNSFRKLETFASYNPADVNYPRFRGSSSFYWNGSRNISFEPQIQYNGYVSKGVLDVLIGGSIQNTITRQESLLAWGFTSDALLRNLASAGDLFASNNSSQYRYAALFGRVSYNWENKYIIDIAGRRDGSSRFGPGNQFGNFGSIGAGWIFTEEPFMQAFTPLSFGKLRFSYGSSGNDAIGDYQYMERYQAINGVQLYQGARGYRTNGLFNTDYAWESVRKMEFGLETGFLNDRIFLNTSYYRNRSDNQLRYYPMPSFAGYGGMMVNLPALIQNTGLELLLNTTNIKSKHFIWTTSINFTRNRNKLLEYPDIENSSFGNSLKVGKPFAGFTLKYNYAGVDPSTGRYQFRKKDGSLTFNPQDNTDVDNGRYVEVYTDPKFYGGISNSFSYKNFSLDFLVQYTKRTGYGALTNYVYFAGARVTNFPTLFLERWQKPGDVASIQKVIGSYDEELIRSTEYLEQSNYALEDVSFLRLKNLSFSYSIPARIRQKWRLEDLRVFILGQNLLTLSNYKGMDPETQSTGSLPPLRTITAGIEIRL